MFNFILNSAEKKNLKILNPERHLSCTFEIRCQNCTSEKTRPVLWSDILDLNLYFNLKQSYLVASYVKLIFPD